MEKANTTYVRSSLVQILTRSGVARLNAPLAMPSSAFSIYIPASSNQLFTADIAFRYTHTCLESMVWNTKGRIAHFCTTGLPEGTASAQS